MYRGTHLPLEMFRYCKRNQIPIHGRAPGVEYGRYRRGSTDPTPTGHALQDSNGAVYRALLPRESYDPGARWYSDDGLDYERPESLHEYVNDHYKPRRIKTTSALAPIERPDVVEYGSPLNRAIAGLEIEQAIRDLRGVVDEETTESDASFEGLENLIESMRAQRISVSDYQASASMPELSASQMEAISKMHDSLDSTFGLYEAGDNDSDPFAEASQLFHQQMSLLQNDADGADLFQQHASIEQLVDEQMQQMNAYAMMDPDYMMNPYGMPMDPFGPMPPGLGPMGPGM